MSLSLTPVVAGSLTLTQPGGSGGITATYGVATFGGSVFGFGTTVGGSPSFALSPISPVGIPSFVGSLFSVTSTAIIPGSIILNPH